MSTVKVRVRVGSMEFEVECPPDQVKTAVEQLMEATKEVKLVSRGRRATTCRELIETMWKEGWFSEPKSLSDVWEEMARRGYNYEKSAVAHALADLVREGVLTRRGRPRSYVYVQKTPPIEVPTGEFT